MRTFFKNTILESLPKKHILYGSVIFGAGLLAFNSEALAEFAQAFTMRPAFQISTSLDAAQNNLAITVNNYGESGYLQAKCTDCTPPNIDQMPCFKESFISSDPYYLEPSGTALVQGTAISENINFTRITDGDPSDVVCAPYTEPYQPFPGTPGTFDGAKVLNVSTLGPGTYTAAVTACNLYGGPCTTATSQFTIDASNRRCEFTLSAITANPSPAVTDQNINFSATTSNPNEWCANGPIFNWDWTGNGEDASDTLGQGTNTATHSYPAAGTYTVKLRVYWNSTNNFATKNDVIVNPNIIAPIGYHDVSNCWRIAGWACDGNKYSQALKVNLYQDGPIGGGGVFLAQITADQAGYNQADSDAIKAACGGITGSHRFNYATPAGLKNWGNHPIYAYAVDIDANGNETGGTNPKLTNSPINLQCDGTPPVTPVATDQGLCTASTTITFTGTPSDPESGVQTCEGHIDRDKQDGWDWSGDVGNDGDYTWTNSAQNGQKYYYQYRCKNNNVDPVMWSSDWVTPVVPWSDGITIDTAAPTKSSPAITSGINNYWRIGGPTSYNITAKATDTGCGGVQNIQAYIYDGGNVNTKRGYFAWNSGTTYLDANSTNRMDCTGGGKAEKFSNNGAEFIDLTGCTTSVSAGERTVIFTVIPKANFGDFGRVLDIATKAVDAVGNVSDFTNYNKDFGADGTAPTDNFLAVAKSEAPINSAQGWADLSWTSLSDGAIGVGVNFSSPPTLISLDGATFPVPSANSVTPISLQNLLDNKWYEATLHAEDLLGFASNTVKSFITFDRTAPIAPTFTSAYSSSGNKVALSWIPSEHISTDFSANNGFWASTTADLSNITFGVAKASAPSVQISTTGGYKGIKSTASFSGAERFTVDFYPSANTGLPVVIALDNDDGANLSVNRFAILYDGPTGAFKAQYRKDNGVYTYPLLSFTAAPNSGWYTMDIMYDGNGAATGCVYAKGGQPNGANCFSTGDYFAHNWVYNVKSWSNVNSSYLSNLKGLSYAISRSASESEPFVQIEAKITGTSYDDTAAKDLLPPAPPKDLFLGAGTTSSTVNLAAASQGGSAIASTNQANYDISESIDGILTTSGNGWAYNNVIPSEGIYKMAGGESINSLEILSGVDRADLNPNDFLLFFTTDANPALNGNWQNLAGISFKNTVANGVINGNRVTLTGQDLVQLSFTPVYATALKIKIQGSNGAANENSVITEFKIFPVITSDTTNLAAASQGGSAIASTNQDNYNISESIDDTLTTSGNGWAYNAVIPSEGVYKMATGKNVNSIEMLSGVDRADHNPDDFYLYYTTDANPALNGNWQPLAGIAFKNTTVNGVINGNHVTLIGQDLVQLSFTPLYATALKIKIQGSNTANNNSVLTEFKIFGTKGGNASSWSRNNLPTVYWKDSLDQGATYFYQFKATDYQGNNSTAINDTINYAAASQGGSAIATTNQASFDISESIDGTLTTNSNGWAYNAVIPSEGVYKLAALKNVNSIEILSGVDRADHNPDDFYLYYTTDANPAVAGNWQNLSGLFFRNKVVAGGVTGNHVTLTGQDIVQISFPPVSATGIKIKVQGSNAPNNNSVITEFKIFGGIQSVAALSGLDEYATSWSVGIQNITPPNTPPTLLIIQENIQNNTPAASLADGNNIYFNVLPKDNAGNWEVAANTLHFGPLYIDKTPPNVASLVINAGAAKTSDANVSLTLTATDVTSGVSQMQLSCNGTTWTRTLPFPASPLIYSFNLISGDTQAAGSSGDNPGCNDQRKQRPVYARFLDRAGNISNIASDDINFSDKKPYVSIPRDEGYASSDLVFYFEWESFPSVKASGIKGHKVCIADEAKKALPGNPGNDNCILFADAKRDYDTHFVWQDENRSGAGGAGDPVANVRYYIKVQARDESGATSDWSEWSDGVIGLIPEVIGASNVISAGDNVEIPIAKIVGPGAGGDLVECGGGKLEFDLDALDVDSITNGTVANFVADFRSGGNMETYIAGGQNFVPGIDYNSSGCIKNNQVITLNMRLENPIASKRGLYFVNGEVATPSAKDITDGLVLYTPYKNAGNLGADMSGMGNTGTVSGAVSFVDGNHGKAAEFHGKNDFINIPSSNSLNITNALTVMTWVKLNAASQTMIRKNNADWLLEFGNGATNNAGTNPQFYVTTSTPPGNYFIYGDEPLELDRWYNLAATFDASGGKIYVDGNVVGVQTQSANLGTLVTSQSYLRLGGWGNEDFFGALDETRIFNRALSRDEIMQVINRWKPEPLVYIPFDVDENGKLTALDMSGNGKNGTPANKGELPSIGQSGQAVLFQGAQPSIALPNNAINLSNTNFSLSAWIKININDLADNGRYPIIVQDAPGKIGDNPDAWGLYGMEEGSKEMKIAFKMDTREVKSSRITVNDWHFVTVTVNKSGKETLYIDGDLDLGGSTDVKTVGVLDLGAKPISIGSAGAIAPFFKTANFPGQIDEVYIYDRVITRSEIVRSMVESSPKIRIKNSANASDLILEHVATEDPLVYQVIPGDPCWANCSSGASSAVVGKNTPSGNLIPIGDNRDNYKFTAALKDTFGNAVAFREPLWFKPAFNVVTNDFEFKFFDTISRLQVLDEAATYPGASTSGNSTRYLPDINASEVIPVDPHLKKMHKKIPAGDGVNTFSFQLFSQAPTTYAGTAEADDNRLILEDLTFTRILPTESDITRDGKLLGIGAITQARSDVTPGIQKPFMTFDTGTTLSPPADSPLQYAVNFDSLVQASAQFVDDTVVEGQISNINTEVEKIGTQAIADAHWLQRLVVVIQPDNMLSTGKLVFNAFYPDTADFIPGASPLPNFFEISESTAGTAFQGLRSFLVNAEWNLTQHERGGESDLFRVAGNPETFFMRFIPNIESTLETTDRVAYISYISYCLSGSTCDSTNIVMYQSSPVFSPSCAPDTSPPNPSCTYCDFEAGQCPTPPIDKLKLSVVGATHGEEVVEEEIETTNTSNAVSFEEDVLNSKEINEIMRRNVAELTRGYGESSPQHPTHAPEEFAPDTNVLTFNIALSPRISFLSINELFEQGNTQGKLLVTDDPSQGSVIWFTESGSGADHDGYTITITGSSDLTGAPKTIILEGVNLYLKGNIMGDSNLGIILLKKRDLLGTAEYNQYGNLLIDPSVTNISAVVYAEGSILTMDETLGIFDGFAYAKNTDAWQAKLKNQLFLYGVFASQNTAGGSSKTKDATPSSIVGIPNFPYLFMPYKDASSPYNIESYASLDTDADTRLKIAERFDLKKMRKFVRTFAANDDLNTNGVADLFDACSDSNGNGIPDICANEGPEEAECTIFPDDPNLRATYSYGNYGVDCTPKGEKKWLTQPGAKEALLFDGRNWMNVLSYDPESGQLVDPTSNPKISLYDKLYKSAVIIMQNRGLLENPPIGFTLPTTLETTETVR
ncbi:hypothetical protein HZA38_02230 [Candidatus Peregrinibacteria bacterium]|nr:hypothetical protein [Candidatus Peregrinibacteria bacterium]